MIAEHLREEAGPNVEKHFALELQRTLDLLSENPDMGRKTARPATHLLLMARFPYHLIYKRMRGSELRIIRIRHAHRRPLTWL
jgi:plasmid stabilization system protein ParE